MKLENRIDTQRGAKKTREPQRMKNATDARMEDECTNEIME